LFQQGRSQQQSLRPGAAGAGPAAGLFADIGVTSDPRNVGVEGLDQPVQTLVEQCRIIEEDKIQPGQRSGYFAVRRPAKNHRRQSLVERIREVDFLFADIGGQSIRTEDKHDGVGLRDERLDPLPPVLERQDFGPVNRGDEPSFTQCQLEPVGERDVVSGVGDEYSGFGTRAVVSTFGSH